VVTRPRTGRGHLCLIPRFRTGAAACLAVDRVVVRGVGDSDGATDGPGWTSHGATTEETGTGTGTGDGLGRGATITGENAVAGRTAGVEAGLAETDCCTVAVATIAMRIAPLAARTRARWDGVWSDLKNVFLRALGQAARGGWPGAAGIARRGWVSSVPTVP